MAHTRPIAVVTTGRADYGLMTPVLRAAAAHGGLTPAVYATGAHLSARHGRTIDRIESDGWTVGARIETEADDDSGDSPDRPMHEKIARAVAGFGDAFRAHKPDCCLLLGDRFETIAAALAASACGVPIAHIHGGELSTGALDNQFRYAITALASLHCVATEGARTRLIAMGEDPASVVRTGAPGLDHLAGFEPMPRGEFVREAGLAAGLADEDPFLLVTLHPETIAETPPAEQAVTLVCALESLGMPCLVTAANQDPGGDAITAALRDACGRHGWPFAEALGPLYHHAMAHAAAMVGNSSSGIIEAASLRLPVVNIGERQGGRERSGNVIDCAHDAVAIESSVRDALAMDTAHIENLYGEGNAGPRIADALASMPLGPDALIKHFGPPGLVV